MRPSRTWSCAVAAMLVALLVVAPPVAAQITNGTLSGSVKDSSGAVIPGATVTLASATRGTNQETTTSAEGEFVFTAVQADTYSVKVTLSGFKTLDRPGVVVHAGDKIALGTMTIEVGALEETVVVSGEAPMIQSQSGERAFAISNESIQAIAQNGRNFNTFTTLAPGFVAGTVNGLRANQNTTQIDGVTSMDTGNNGSEVTLTIDAVQEVKVLTTNYQAEYGRSAGAQISAVTKSGGNDFHGSAYAIRRKDDLNANTWLNKRNGLPKARVNQSDEGYTLGGPIIRSKLFFFGNQEFQQRLNANNLQRVRVPTDLERNGDFSQTRDNSGNLFNLIRDSTTGLPCTAADTRGCFQDGGVGQHRTARTRFRDARGQRSVQAGNGIDEHLYKNRGLHYAPRFGFAYDVTGVQRFVVRGGAGVFYDRAAGDTVYAMIEQPPTVAAPNLFYGRLQDIAGSSGTLAPPTIAAFDYEAKIPTVYAFNAGFQVQLPWTSALDVSYVGSKSRNLNTQVNINAPDYGVAYRAENQDPTVGACPAANGCAAVSNVPGANALPVDFLRPYRGFGDIIQIQPTSYSDYNSLQTSWNRRFRNGLSFGVNYVLGQGDGHLEHRFPRGQQHVQPDGRRDAARGW